MPILTGAMTESQLTFITNLVRDKIADPAARCEKLLYAAGCDKAAASTLIDELKALTSTAAPAQDIYTPPAGSYLVNGKVYTLKVPKHKTSVTYVCHQSAYIGTWGKTPDLANLQQALSNQEAAYAAVVAFAKATGKCGKCHTKLTDPKSIAAGIGPVCAKKYGKAI